MRQGRGVPATWLFLAAAAASGAGVPLACGVSGAVAASSGSGGAPGTGGHAATGSSSHSTAASSTTGTGGAATTGTGSGGAPGTGGGAATTASGGASSVSGTGGGGGGGGAPEATVTLHPNAPPLPGEGACTVVEVSNIPEPDFVHLPICTPIAYATNPPSGGDHWPIWAAYTEYATPVPRELYVHDLEHGAIVLAYRCADACPDVVSALQMVFASEVDPICLELGAGPLGRMVLTPDPLLPTPIAASAWGATYTATCIDVPSLQAFANAHYGNGRESFCSDGVDPASIVCVDGGDGG